MQQQLESRLPQSWSLSMPNNEFGDFQTPLALAEQCLKVLGLPAEEKIRILEPTCGIGNFLQAASLRNPDSERKGYEINKEYVSHALSYGDVQEKNIFKFSLSNTHWNSDSPLFVIGNPPWVTAAELKRMDSDNIPDKSNFKHAKGIDALLGSSNFDVCEYIILKCLNELSHQKFTLGMLCKTQVARNVLEQCYKASIPLIDSSIYPINAKKWFDAGVDACWFVAKIDPEMTPNYVSKLYKDVFEEPNSVQRSLGVVDNRFVSNVEEYLQTRIADGVSPYTWRSGLKHDASKVFELKATPAPETKSGKKLDLEPNYLFPFLKSTDIFRGRHRELSKWVIVPQMVFGEETAHLEHTAPKLWQYLTSNAEVLDGRKSSIYRNRPRFSVFGHGEYTFAPFKVSCSGLHKEPRFQLVAPIEGKPVVLDDTCYFLPFDNATLACQTLAILQSQECQALLQSLVFWDSKRPITKKLLSRIDLFKVPCNQTQIMEQAQKIAIDYKLIFNEQEALEQWDNLQQETLF